MAKKKTPKRTSRKNAGLTIQRGGEEFTLEKSTDSFVVKRKLTNESGPLTALAHSPEKFPGLTLDRNRSPRGLEVYRMAADLLNDTMIELRKSPDVAWCGHVYHMQGDPNGQMIPSDGIFVEVDPAAKSEEVNKLLQEHGLELVPDVDGEPNAFIVRLTAASKENPIKIANALRKSQAVLLAEPDLAVSGRLHIHRPTDDLFQLQWHLENRGGFGLTAGVDVSATAAWDITRGDRTITVAVIDDGFDTGHQDFGSPGKVVAPVDFGEGDQDASPVTSADNHGTACAGVAVADENGVGVVGLAPECRLMPIRWSGSVSDLDIREQFDHARTNGADVISCSWGVAAKAFTLSTSMKRTITRAATEGRNGKGCVILFAAGNESSDIDDLPRTRSGFAIHPDVIAVAASNSNDVQSHYSNFGDRIWICAPSSGAGGLGIVTTDRRGSKGYQSGDYTTIERFGGTSSSTPLAAGLCGLMLSINPDLTAEDVREILKDTAEKIDQQDGEYNQDGHSPKYGYGRINGARALEEAQNRRTGGVTEQVIQFENQPNLAIPDRNPVGVSDSIQVNRSGLLESVEVEVDITHTYRGDLRLTLVSPDGTSVRLFGRTAPAGDSRDNLVTTFTADNVPSLSQLRGKNVLGAWTLQVVDLAAADVGALNSWKLTLGIAGQETEFEVFPGERIPDNNAAGINSDINVAAGGALRNIEVRVDITHTYRGDLRVTLTPPAGNAVELQSVDNEEGADNLVQSYSPSASPGLAQLVAQRIDIRGRWRLNVSDNLAQDIGKLNSWALKLST
jgi:subtilisin-like proprotein convertase family protein